MTASKGTYVVENPGSTHQLSRDGLMYYAATPTPGTAFATDVKIAFDPLVPFMYMYNGDTVGAAASRSVELVSVKLICTVAAASSTNFRFGGQLDNVIRTPTTDNMTALAPKCPNGNVSTASALAGTSGLIKMQSSGTASAAPAASANVRTIGRGSMGGITLVNDEFTIMFGRLPAGGTPGLTAAQATCAGSKVSYTAPVIIPPGWSFYLYTWYASNAVTGPSFEAEVQWIERAASDA